MDTERYKLKVMPVAANDLRGIYEYISQELSAPLAAHNLMEKVEKSFLFLREMPESCPRCQNGVLYQKGLRKLLVGNYIALYTIDKISKTVLVMRVVHGRQEYSTMV